MTRRRAQRKPWSPEEIELAASLHASGVTYPRIGAQLGRTGRAVEARLMQFINARPARSFDRERPGPHLTQDLVADRDARALAAQQRDLTAEFFGDPPPGRSALDQRNNGSARP